MKGFNQEISDPICILRNSLWLLWRKWILGEQERTETSEDAVARVQGRKDGRWDKEGLQKNRRM